LNSPLRSTAQLGQMYFHYKDCNATPGDPGAACNIPARRHVQRWGNGSFYKRKTPSAAQSGLASLSSRLELARKAKGRGCLPAYPVMVHSCNLFDLVVSASLQCEKAQAAAAPTFTSRLLSCRDDVERKGIVCEIDARRSYVPTTPCPPSVPAAVTFIRPDSPTSVRRRGAAARCAHGDRTPLSSCPPISNRLDASRTLLINEK
jgi:hypothetical protein